MAQPGPDTTSHAANPVPFAPGYPKRWGTESHTLHLSQHVDCLSSPVQSHKFLAVTSGREIQIHRLTTLELLETLRGHEGDVHVVSFLNDNVLVSSESGSLRRVIIWTLDDEGKNINTHGGALIDVNGLAEAAADAVLDRVTTTAGGAEWDQQDRAQLITALVPAIASSERQHLLRQELSFEGTLLGFGSDPWLRPVELGQEPKPNPSALLVHMSREKANSIILSQLVPGESRGEDAPTSSNSVKTFQPVLQDQANSSVMWAQFSPDRKMLAVVSWDEYARIYATPQLQASNSDVAPVELLYTIGPTGGQNWVGAWHPSSEYFAFTQGSPRTIVHVYQIPLPGRSNSDIGAPKLVHRQTAFQSWCRSLAWSPRGDALLCAADSKVLLYDPFKGSIDREFSYDRNTELTDKGSANRGIPRPIMLGECGNAQWISQNRALWTTGDGGIEMYDRDQELRYRWEPREHDKPKSGFWSSQVVLHDGRMIVADGDNAVRVWDLPL
jgi:WD40 repeat protein